MEKPPANQSGFVMMEQRFVRNSIETGRKVKDNRLENGE